MNQRRNRNSRWRIFGGSRRRRSSSRGGFVNMLWAVVPVAGFIGTYLWGEDFWRERFNDAAEWVQRVEPTALNGMLENAGLPQIPPRIHGADGSKGHSTATPSKKAPPPGGVDKERAHFNKCAGRKRYTCVVDGDTLWYKGEKIRIADINAPETGKPDCASERALGEKATKRLIVLMNQGPFSLGPNSDGRTTDFYGRRLATIDRNGQSLGMQLVREGLAEEWTGRRRNWCQGFRR